MANKEQLKALLDSYFNDDKERFISTALQVAASAAKKGQGNLATELKEIIDRGRNSIKNHQTDSKIESLSLDKDLSALFNTSKPEVSLRDVVFSNEIDTSLRKVISEQKQRLKLKEFDLKPISKILLIGPPGTGKTLTSKILASELNLPLFTVQFEGLLSRYMGESAAKLKLVFNKISDTRAIYLFDEFDAIGAKRTKDNDVGEIRRVLNTFLQLLENINSDSLIIAATNHPELLDEALFRRFDKVIYYNNPDANVIEALLKDRLYSFAKDQIDWKKLASLAEGLNHSEIVKACNEISKEIILNDKFFISLDSLRGFFNKN